MNERMKAGHPKVGATVEVTQLELQCNRQQFLGISYLHQWVTLHRYRPIASVAKDPRGWWDYAYQLATRMALPRTKRRFTAASIAGLRGRRTEYIGLYKRTFETTPPPTPLTEAVRCWCRCC